MKNISKMFLVNNAQDVPEGVLNSDPDNATNITDNDKRNIQTIFLTMARSARGVPISSQCVRGICVRQNG